MAPRGPADRPLVAVLVLVGLLTLLYSVLVAQQVLLWFVLAVLLAFVYLLWRAVRALERIADASATAGDGTS